MPNGERRFPSFDAVATSIATALHRSTENRAVRMAVAAQPFIYAALTWKLLDKYQVPFENAALYPVLRLLNVITPVSSIPKETNDLIIAALSADLYLFGGAVTVATSALVGKKLFEIARGEGTIDDSNAVIFLNIGKDRRLAEPLGQHVQITHPNGKVNNLFFASIGRDDLPKLTRPKGFTPPHFATQTNIQMDATNPDLLRKAGVSKAKTIIISGEDDRLIEEAAYVIKTNRADEPRIIPIPANLNLNTPFETIDQDSREKLVLTENPINPYKYFASKLADLKSEDDSKRLAAIDFFTAGIPNTKHKTLGRTIKQLRREKLDEKMRNLGWKPPRIYLDGNPESQDYRSLQSALGEENISSNFADTDIIVTVADGLDHTGCNDCAETVKNKLAENSDWWNSKIHLYLDFSTANEDSMSENAEAGASIQRLVVAELTERIEDDLTFKTSRKFNFEKAVQQAEKSSTLGAADGSFGNFFFPRNTIYQNFF